MPSPNGSDDIVGISLPDERAWFLVMLGDEVVDGGLQIDDGVEGAVFRRLLPARLRRRRLSWE